MKHLEGPGTITVERVVQVPVRDLVPGDVVLAIHLNYDPATRIWQRKPGRVVEVRPSPKGGWLHVKMEGGAKTGSWYPETPFLVRRMVEETG